MNRPLIDHHQAIQGLRQAVAERGPDYRDPNAGSYGGCRYVKYGEPSCIGAVTLFKLGVPLDELAKWEGIACAAMVTDQPSTATRRGTGDGFLTPRAASVLTEAQNSQDKGRTWGTALAGAEDVYRLYTEMEEQR